MRTRRLLAFPLLLSTAAMLIAGYWATATMAESNVPASLTINVYTCDDLHDPIDPNQTLVNECALSTDDIAFTLEPSSPSNGSMSASTGSGGAPATIAFTQLTPGAYRLSQDTPATIAQSYVSTCTSNVRTFDYPFSPFAIVEPHGRLNIELMPGEQLACDWYNIQASDAATATTLTVTVYSCDGDVIDPELCDRAPGVELRLVGPSAGITITADDSGVATFDGEGVYELEPISELEDRDFCGFYDDTGNAPDLVDLSVAEQITLDGYYCYLGA